MRSYIREFDIIRHQMVRMGFTVYASTVLAADIVVQIAEGTHLKDYDWSKCWTEIDPPALDPSNAPAWR